MIRALRWMLVPAMLVLAACGDTNKPDPNPPVPSDPKLTLAGPEYSTVAAGFNANVEPLKTFFASTIVRMKWIDRDEQRRNEQGEGRLQVMRPDRVAMSVGKVGEVFFWLGCDAQRYWWFDLSDKPRTLFVGTHDRYETSAARRVGVVVPPRDLVCLLGIVPLPEQGGLTQYSSDKKLIGVTTNLPSGQRQRMWLNPVSWLPVKIELYNTFGDLELVADLSQPDSVDIRGYPNKPTINTRAIIGHQASRSEITIDLSDMQDGKDRIVPEAFNLNLLAQRLRAEKAYDLDTPLPSTSSSSPAKK